MFLKKIDVYINNKLLVKLILEYKNQSFIKKKFLILFDFFL